MNRKALSPVISYGDPDLEVVTYLHITRYENGNYKDSYDVTTDEGTVIHKGQTEKREYILSYVSD